MVDNTDLNTGSGGDKIATKDVTHGGDANTKLQSVSIMGVSGTEGSYTIADINGTAANGLEVDVTRVTGTVTVDGSGATQPVSGTVTANLSATDNAVLDDIAAQVTTVAALSQAEDSQHTSTDPGIMALGVRNDTLAALGGTDGDYVPLQADANGALWVHEEPGEVDSGNSSTTPLNSGIAFTGTGIDVLNYTTITVTMDASHDSATDGLSVQFSTDNSNWDDVYPWTYTAANGARRFQFPVTARYFRVVYTNGGTNQTHFRLQTILHHTATLTSVHRLNDDMSPDRSAQVMKAAIFARTSGAGDFKPIAANASGKLQVAADISGETVTANLSATDNAVLDSIVTNTTGLAGTVSGSELQVDVVAALPAGTNAIGKLAANSGVDIGDVDVTSISAGSNLIGDVAIGGRATGGSSVYYDNDLDETAIAVKASAGTLYSIHAINTTAAPLYLQLFNVAQGSVTVGTTTPTMQLIIPGNADSDGAGFTWSIPQGISFGTAITAAASTNSEGNGAPGANACHVNIVYK